jgi:RND superfamily putative drug exporter
MDWIFDNFQIVVLIAVVGLGRTFGGDLNDKFELPNTESKVATDLLTSSGTDTSRLEGGASIVWSPASGTSVDEASAAIMLPLLTELSNLPSVTCVSNPFDPKGTPLGRECTSGGAPNPAAMAALTDDERLTLASSFSTVSPDGKVAYSSISFATDASGSLNVSSADAMKIIDGVKALNSADMAVGAQGQVLEFAGMEPPSGELIGIVVAILILLIAFGSIVAAGIPIVVALLGLYAAFAVVPPKRVSVDDDGPGGSI